jgi:hypothetical protein
MNAYPWDEFISFPGTLTGLPRFFELVTLLMGCHSWHDLRFLPDAAQPATFSHSNCLGSASCAPAV